MSVNTITIPKKEYTALQRESRAYRRITSRVFETVVQDDIPSIVADFRKTETYTDEFLKDFEEGLGKSSYGKT